MRAGAAALLLAGAVACGTVDATAVVEYLNSLDRLRAGTQSVDAGLASRFESLIAANSGDAAAYIAVYEGVRSSNAELLAQLRGLRPPDILADHHADLAGGLEDLINGVDEVSAVIEGGDLREGNRLFQRTASRSATRQAGAILQMRRAARGVGVRP